jgi:protein-S-isoprenylcysteine O-methyltransferase Ste14
MSGKNPALVLSPIRCLALAAIFAVGNAWIVHHFGVRPTTLLVVNGFLALASWGSAWLRKQELEALQERARHFLDNLTSTSALVSLFLVMARIYAEENLLLTEPVYAEYKKRVRYRLVPGIW